MLIVLQANKYEQILAKRADGISQNLHQALDRHNRLVNDDVTAALVEHVRSSIMYERQLLRELEALRPDVNSAADKAIAKPNGVPRPTYVPPLEDAPLKFAPPPISVSTPVSARIPSPIVSGVPSGVKQEVMPPQSPGAGPSRSPLPTATSFTSTTRPFMPTTKSFTPPVPPPSASGPPLGGRFVDGTKSMFIHPTPSPLTASPSLGPPTPAQPQSHDPLMGAHPLGRSFSVPAVETNEAFDPLGQARPAAFMSASMRVQPSRPRLDAREAASKLANMF